MNGNKRYLYSFQSNTDVRRRDRHRNIVPNDETRMTVTLLQTFPEMVLEVFFISLTSLFRTEYKCKRSRQRKYYWYFITSR